MRPWQMEPEDVLARVIDVAGLSERDLAAFYAREYGPLVALLSVIGRSRPDAEEIAQDAFVWLYEHWDQISRYDDPTAWLRTVAVRLLISRYRRAEVAKRFLPFLRASVAASVEEPADISLDLAMAFEQLSPPQRAVVVLHHLYELPVDEVATALRVPVGTVKSRLARARGRLEPLLADHVGRTHHD